MEKLTATIEQWQNATKELKRLKALEMKLRKELFNKAFPSPQEGTNNVDIEGFAFKGVHKLNYSVEEALIPGVTQALTKLGKNPEDIFKTKVSLIRKGFENLTGQAKDILEEAVTIKEGAPTLSITTVE